MSTVGRHPVCIFPNREVVEILLKVGADTNAVDNCYNTPLHILANTKCPQSIFDLLIKYNAHFDAVNKDGETFEDMHKLNYKNIKYFHLSCAINCTDSSDYHEHVIIFEVTKPKFYK